MIYDEPESRGLYHNHKLRPSETPQKIVRVDSGKRTRENHYLERLLINENIVSNEEAISVFPSEHRIIRR